MDLSTLPHIGKDINLLSRAKEVFKNYQRYSRGKFQKILIGKIIL